MLTGPSLALPIQGNLVVTSGEVRTFRGFSVQSFGTYTGAGFTLRLSSGTSSFGGTSTPDAYATLPGGLIAPGTVVTPFHNANLDPPGQANILGVEYGLFCQAQPCIPAVFGGVLNFTFTQSFTLPPVGLEPLTLVGPFVFDGSVGIHHLNLSQLFDLTLTGEGTGTARFLPQGDGWRFDGSSGENRYVFGEVPQPIPEPATLLLWGSGGRGAWPGPVVEAALTRTRVQ